MKTKPCARRSGQSGFSLIEIMVGMVIGLLAIIVMMQVFAVSEERKRTANAGSDAQNSAVIALDGIQRHIGQSGYGFALTRLLGCNLQLPFGAPVPLAPVIINPRVDPFDPTSDLLFAGDANTDTLLVSYGLGNDQPEGYNVLSLAGSTYTIIGTSMLRDNDRVIATPPGSPPTAACTLPTLSLQRVNGTPPASVVTTHEVAVVGTAALFNLGVTPRFLAYAVRNGNLVVCDYMAADCGDDAAASLANPAIWRLVAENIVSLRAQYGQDTSGPPMDGIVDAYNRTTPTTACLWARTPAIRLALVARSAQFEKDAVTTVAPRWAGSDSAVPLSAQPINIDLSGDANWGNYRYRVFETVVPIRNVAWMGASSGC
jgi:type IV pilus assembly protein PilW